MGTDLSVRDGMDIQTIGSVLVKSGFFADTREQSQAIVKVLAGRELGFGPIASMQGVYIVKGRVTLSANLVGAAIQRSGKYGYRVETLTDEECVLRFYEGGKPIGESSFSLEDAKTAGLISDTYRKFPRNMLFARALTNGARWYCPEVFNGPIYTPDELGAVVDDEGVVVEHAPPPAPVPTTTTTDMTTGEIVERPLPPEERDEYHRGGLEGRWKRLWDEAATFNCQPEPKFEPTEGLTDAQLSRRVEQLQLKINTAKAKEKEPVSA